MMTLYSLFFVYFFFINIAIINNFNFLFTPVFVIMTYFNLPGGF